MIFSFLIYFTTMLVLFTMASIFSLTSNNIKVSNGHVIVMIMAISIVFAIIFGMRWDVGQDNLDYLYSYINNNTSEYEFLYKAINDSLYLHKIHYSVYFGLIAFIQLFLLLYSFTQKRYLWPFLIIALFGGHFFLDWMNVMRQETASCIAFYGIKYVVRKDPWKYLLCILIAFGFHKSAIILLPIYPIFVSGKDLTPNRWVQCLIIVIISSLDVYHFDILSRIFPIINTLQELVTVSNYSRYNQNVLQSFSEITKIGILFYIFIVLNIIIIYYSSKLKKFFASRGFKIIYNLYFWGCTLELVVATNMVLARPFRYFRIYKLVILAYLMYYLFKNNNLVNSNLLIVIICLMLAGVILVSSYAPFNFFFNISYAP